MLLLLGIILGCLNAWHWLSQEHQKIDKDSDASEMVAEQSRLDSNRQNRSALLIIF